MLGSVHSSVIGFLSLCDVGMACYCSDGATDQSPAVWRLILNYMYTAMNNSQLRGSPKECTEHSS